MSKDGETANIVHTLIQNVLNVTIRKSERNQTQPNQSEHPKLYIGHLYGRVTGITDTEGKYLTIEDLDDLVRSVIYVNILHNKNVLLNLNEIYTRTVTGLAKLNKLEGLNQLFNGVDISKQNINLLKPQLVRLVEDVQTILVSNASLMMIFPMYFNLTDVINESEIKRAYLKVTDEKELSDMYLDFATSTHNCTFLQNITTAMWDNDENAAKTVFMSVFNTLRMKLSLSSLKQSMANEVKFLTEVLVYKPLVEVFLENVSVCELEMPFFKSCGMKRELMTIFGRLLTVTTLDEEGYEVSKLLGLKNIYEMAKVDRTTDFYGKKDLNHLKSVINSKRFEGEHAMNSILQMVKLILKCDTSIRNQLLIILGRIVSFNTNRKKIFGLTNIDSAPFSLDRMYYHKLVMISDNSFGYCVNLTWLLLLLSQGINMIKADEIELSFCQTANLATKELGQLEAGTSSAGSSMEVDIEAVSGTRSSYTGGGISSNVTDDTYTGNNSVIVTDGTDSDTNTFGTTTASNSNILHNTSDTTASNTPNDTTLDRKSEEEDAEERKKYLNKIETDMKNMLGFLCSSSCMGDENSVKESLNQLNVDANTLYNSKFITQIFWVTLKGLNMLFLPSLQENLKLLTQTLNYANTTSNLGANDDKLANYISHVYVWRAALQHPSLLKALWHYVNISLRVFLRSFLFYDAEGRLREDYKEVYETHKGKYSLLVEKYCEHVVDTDAAVAPPQFTVLPVELIETVLEVIKNMTILRQYDHYIKPADGDPLSGMDFELVISACIFIMKCPNDVIKNIHIKCEMACSTILYLCKFSEESVPKFESINVCKQHLMDSLVRTFISSQKSSYNTRISSRLNIIQSFTQFFVHASYKKSFVSCIISKKDLFVQFMHLLLNDTNFLVEEVVSYLTEIRRREVAGISLEESGAQESEPSGMGGSGPNSARNHQQQDEDADTYVQEGAIDANQLKSMSGPELKSRTRSFVEYGFEICSLLNILCSEFPSDITSSSVLLPQVATCLGCCLESLAGPKCLQLKVKNMDEYGFKPREWLSKIMKCYISLYENDPEPALGPASSSMENSGGAYVGNDYEEENNPFVKAVVGDERYYKPELFTRCVRFATREMLLNYKSIKSFNNLSNRLLEHAKRTSMLYENASNAEIPEHYLDPIMMDVMEDPVLLPTSGKIMDRKNIERHLMSEATDPFTRAPLDRSQLVDQPELKREIYAFLRSLSRSSTNP